jgi:putative OPT family oligopeptide transporter
LISTLAQGVLTGQQEWGMIGLGAALGVALILLDVVLGRLRLLRLPPLAVGIAIYLPMSATLMVVIGAVCGWVYERAAPAGAAGERYRRMGVLAATGLIVGESLLGVLLAGIVVATGDAAPLAIVGDGFEPFALWGGLLVFALLAFWLYRRSARLAQ